MSGNMVFMQAQSEQQSKEISANIWKPRNPLPHAAWLWWFWLFFIHDENTKKTGKCRQIMILWSTKRDDWIKCNACEMRMKVPITEDGEKFILNGAHAAWYYDGKKMHHDFVLETSMIVLDTKARKIIAPGKTPSSFREEDGSYITSIQAEGHSFELVAKQTDFNPAVGPNYTDHFIGPFEIEGTRIEILQLSGKEKTPDGTVNEIKGTAYFQKILVAAPVPQWYWGIYHFKDGSYATYMHSYIGKAIAADNLWKGATLGTPALAITHDITVYHAPSGRLFNGNKLTVVPEKSGIQNCWNHKLTGSGKGFTVSGVCESYAQTCWAFTKNIWVLPIKSNLHYNEYPAVMKKLELRLDSGEIITLENGWGNMENTWGVLI